MAPIPAYRDHLAALRARRDGAQDSIDGDADLERTRALRRGTVKKLAPMLEPCAALECDARWEEMKGDETTRVCGVCGLCVYDPASISQSGRAAIGGAARLYVRGDGTITLSDCSRRRRSRRVSLAVAAIASAALLAGAMALASLSALSPDPGDPPARVSQ